jgi:hypothetical protein
MYGFLADAMVALHLLYVSFVVFGQLAVVLAAAMRWEWGRNRWFRLTHLAAIGYVALEAVMGWKCPLTLWEQQLRELAGQDYLSSDTFMGRLVRSVLFIDRYFTDGEPPEGFFTTVYIATFIIVLQGLVMYPPRLWPKRAAA